MQPQTDPVVLDMFDAYPAPTLLVDSDVRVLRLNPAAQAAAGHEGSRFSPGERGGDALGCVHAAAGGCGTHASCGGCVLRRSVARALTTGAVHRARTFMQLRRGGATVEVCMLVSAAPVRDAGDTRVLLTLEDVSDLSLKDAFLRTEQALRASEERVRTTLDAILSPGGDVGTLELADLIEPEPLRGMMEEFNRFSHIPIAIIDVHGKVLVEVGWQEICTRFHRAHPETCRRCVESDTSLSAGIAEGEVRRYKCRNNMCDVATPITLGDRQLGNVFMGQFFFDDEPVDEEVFRAQARRYGFDEHEYLAALAKVPRLTRDAVESGLSFFLRFARILSRSSLGHLKLARTLAERETLMASLKRSNERLAESDRRKTEFLSLLSHELRNPLAPIRNSLYLLERVPPGGAQAMRAREVASRQLGHLTRLVDDLLDITRISHGKIRIDRAMLDLRDLVLKVSEDNRACFEAAGVALGVELPPEAVRVEADHTRIAQALGNLMQNARKFTPPGGRVDISVAQVDGRAEVSVRDTGVGIAAADLARMFEPFAQAQQGLARTQGGLGLGLALVRGLIELHGGEVRGASAGPGRGATFVISLPAAEA